MTERQVLSIVARSLLLAVLIGAIAWFAWTVRSVLVLLLVAVILATGLSPIVDAIAGVRPERKRLRLSRGLATLVLYLGLIAGLALLPRENRPLAEVALDQARVKIAGWLMGQALLSTIIGATTFVGLVLLGVPYALLLAVVAAIGELIPILGPVLSAVPAVVVASYISPVRGLLTLGLYVLIQQLENHVVVPQVMRRAVDLPPVVVIVALLMGSEALGVVGAIIALPVAAAVSVVVGEVVALRDARAEAPTAPNPPTG